MIRKVYEVDPLVCPKCGGFPAPFRLFQPDLTRSNSLIDHP